jgi:hypothetical protein
MAYWDDDDLPNVQTAGADPEPVAAMAGGFTFGGAEATRRMAEINAANPGGENPDLPYVQGGNTGGYIRGIGETIGAGRSTTPAQAAAFVDEVKGMGASDEWVADMLARNPNDFSRLKAMWLDETTDQPDSNGGGAGGPGGGYGAGGAGGWRGGPGGASGGGSGSGGGTFYGGAPQTIQPFSFDASKVGTSDAFRFVMDKAMKALERRGAAKGVYRTPQTTDALQAEAAGLASQEFEREHARQFGEHQFNETGRYESARTNRADDFTFGNADRYYGLDTEKLGLDRERVGLQRDDLGLRRDMFSRGIFESDRGFGRNVLESDRSFGRGTYENDRNFSYGQYRDDINDDWRYYDYGYNAGRTPR